MSEKDVRQEVLLDVLVALERIANENLPPVFHVLRTGRNTFYRRIKLYRSLKH